MKIKRTFYDKEIEIELTDREVCDAYYEQQFIFDREDILCALDHVMRDIKDPEVIKVIEAEADNAAMDMRRSIDKYDCSWEYARDEAVYDLLARVQEMCSIEICWQRCNPNVWR